MTGSPRRSALMGSTAGSSRSAVGRLLPIVDWLPRYDRAMLRGDVLAGIAVTAMIVPKDLGYAGIAGVPVQNGLYAAAAGAIVYALFCTSRHISTGPSSSLCSGRRRGSAVHGGRGRAGCRTGSRDHTGDRGTVPPSRAAAPGLDRTVPVSRRGSRVPGRRRG